MGLLNPEKRWHIYIYHYISYTQSSISVLIPITSNNCVGNVIGNSLDWNIAWYRDKVDDSKFIHWIYIFFSMLTAAQGWYSTNQKKIRWIPMVHPSYGEQSHQAVQHPSTAAAPHVAVAAFARHFSRRRAAAKAHPARGWRGCLGVPSMEWMARSTVASCIETI